MGSVWGWLGRSMTCAIAIPQLSCELAGCFISFQKLRALMTVTLWVHWLRSAIYSLREAACVLGGSFQQSFRAIRRTSGRDSGTTGSELLASSCEAVNILISSF